MELRQNLTFKVYFKCFKGILYGLNIEQNFYSNNGVNIKNDSEREINQRNFIKRNLINKVEH